MNEVIWSPGVTLENIEEQVIKKAYAHFQQNKLATANSLGISERTLYSKLAQYEQQEKRSKEEAELRRKNAEEYQLKWRGLAHTAPNEGVWAEDPSPPADKNTTNLKTKRHAK